VAISPLAGAVVLIGNVFLAKRMLIE